MSKFQQDVMLRIVELLDVTLVMMPFAVCWFFYYAERIHVPFTWVGHLSILAL